MNRVMRSYTPDLPRSPSRLSTTVTMSGSATRRRYSVSSFTANTTTPAPVARSLTQDATTPTINKRMSLHENLMMKILSTPVDQGLNDAADHSSGDESFCSSLGGSFNFEQLLESDDQLRCTTPPNRTELQNNPRLARLYKDLNSPSASTRMRALRALKSPSKMDGYDRFDVPHEEQDIITEEERRTPTERTIQQVMASVCVYIEVRSGEDNRSDGIKDKVASLGAKVNDKLYKNTTHVIFKDGLMSTYQKAKKMNIPVVSVLWIDACVQHLCIMNPAGFTIFNKERYENPELFKKIRRQKSMQPRAEDAHTGSNGKKRPTTNPPGVGSGSASVASAGTKSTKSVISPPARLPVLHRIRKDDGLERILNEFHAENALTQEPQDDYDRMLAGPMRLMEKFRHSPATTMTPPTGGTVAPLKEKEVELATPEVPVKSIRKSLLFGDSAEKATPGRRRSTSKEVTPVAKAPAAARQRRKTTLFTPRVTSVQEEVESPAAVTVVQTSTRSRRKTLAVSMDENSPAKKQQDTIRSPKAMELSKGNSENLQENVPPPTRNTIYSPSKMEQSSDKTDKVVRVEMGPSPRRTLGPKTSENVVKSTSWKKTTPELDAKDLEAFRTNRRRTLYTPGVYDESDKSTSLATKETPVLNRRSTIFNPPANSTANADKTPLGVNSSTTNKRRTLYSASAVEIPETPEEPSQNSRRHTIFTPNPVESASQKTAAQKSSRTLMEEYQSSLTTFSSTRTPISQRRKTIFDISMDIISIRLSQINQQTKLTEPATTTVANRVETAELALKSPPPKPPGSVSRQTSLESFYRKASKSTEKSAKFKSFAASRTISDPEVTTTAPRKRKLFNAPSTESPQSSQGDVLTLPREDNPPKRAKTPPLPTTTTTGISKTPAPSKRRSMAINPVTKSATSTKSSRRSSTLFESIRPATQPARPVMGTQARTMKALGLGAGLPTVSSQTSHSSQGTSSSSSNGGSQFRLATTNLRDAQKAFVKETVSTLGGFLIQQNVTDRTTHLISLGPGRTINILRALARGLWILSYEWVQQSAEAGRWLTEEQFELRDFSPAVQTCRSERQAFGSRYRMDLFGDCGGPFYVSERCGVPQDQLRELIITCKGKITGNALNAKYLVVKSVEDASHVPSGAFCVSPQWILDSITENRMKKTYRYLVRE